MNVQTIEMDREEAARQVEAYRQALSTRGSADPITDRALLRGYKQLAAGQRLLDIVEVMRGQTEYDDQCRPRLAFARATATYCYWRRSTQSSGCFMDRPRVKKRKAKYEFNEVFRDFRACGKSDTPRGYWWEAKARVPMIPLPLRPVDALANYFILFEAEWTPIPPRDPMLLKPLHDNLYVVVAEWNLTDLERAVLQGLMRSET